MRTTPLFGPALLALATAASLPLHAGVVPEPPQYHLVPIDVPGAYGVYVADINDAGVAVGYATSAADFSNLPFLWNGSTAVPLPIPADREDGYATGINASGQIVGYASLVTDTGAETTALLWDAADPSQFVVLDGPAGTGLNPDDINDAGIIVGLAATEGQFNAFQWTAGAGFVDDGVPSHGAGTQAYWAGINNAGTKVGGWYFPGSAVHATAGQVGTPGIGPIAAGVDAVASRATAVNDAGVAVGEMDLDGDGSIEPVTFIEGVAQEVPGARLGLADGTASDINDAGVIVGRAHDFATLEFKAFVHSGGASYDLAQRADNGDLYEYLLNAVAVNDSGAIAGTARGPEFTVASFVALPLTGDGSDLSVSIEGPATYAPDAVVPVSIRIAGIATGTSGPATTGIRVNVPAARVTLQAPAGWVCTSLGGARFAVDCETTTSPTPGVATFAASIATGGKLKLPAFQVRAAVEGAAADPVPGNNQAVLQSRISRNAPPASRAR